MFPKEISPMAARCAQSSLGTPYSAWVQERGLGERGVQLVQVLRECAKHVAARDFASTDRCLRHINELAAVDGALQRLAGFLADGLVRRLLSPVGGVSGALLSPSDASDPVLLDVARRNFFELSPFPRLACVATTQAILEAMENEQLVHIVDFLGPAANPNQWMPLLRDFRNRRGGPPHLRITAVHEDKDFLATMAATLYQEAAQFKMHFEFTAILTRLDTLDFSKLRDIVNVKSNEALAIVSFLQLHRLLATDDSMTNTGITQLQQIADSCPSGAIEVLQRAVMRYGVNPSPGSTLCPISAYTPSPKITKLQSFLSAVEALLPSILVMTEQDANHNSAIFCERFEEALDYYAHLFDSLDAAAAAHGRHQDRARVELLLGNEIRNILACEGRERCERHERLDQWVEQMRQFGFSGVHCSHCAIVECNKLLQSLGLDGYEVRGQDGFVRLCWQKKPLYFISAWRPNKGFSRARDQKGVVGPRTSIVHSQRNVAWRS